MNDVEKEHAADIVLIAFALVVLLACVIWTVLQPDGVTRVTLTPAPAVLALDTAGNGEAEPAEGPVIVRALPTPTPGYVLNLGTGRFHKPGCGHADRIDERNRVETGETREELIEQGFEPCGLCRP